MSGVSAGRILAEARPDDAVRNQPHPGLPASQRCFGIGIQRVTHGQPGVFRRHRPEDGPEGLFQFHHPVTPGSASQYGFHGDPPSFETKPYGNGSRTPI